MAFKFPFTNYHELNLTWVLDQLKKLFEESAENVSVIQTYDGRLTAVETELPTVSENAAEAARSAAAAATLAQTAKATADTAQENAIQAQRAAGTAQNTAERAQEAADAATQAAQQAQATAQNFDGRINQAENDASQALEASRSFENRVQSAITTANNAANTATNAQGIAMRADQNAGTALDRIGDLSQLTTTAKQNLVVAINEAAQTGASADEKAEAAKTAAANIADSIAPVEESATASRSYAVDDLLMYNNRLYKVASAIASGGTLIPGTNITETTIDAELENAGGGGSGGDSAIVPFPFADFLDNEAHVFSGSGRRWTIKGNLSTSIRNYGSTTSIWYSLKSKQFFSGDLTSVVAALSQDEFVSLPVGTKIILKVKKETGSPSITIRICEFDENYSFIKNTSVVFNEVTAKVIITENPIVWFCLGYGNTNNSNGSAHFWLDIAP